MTVEDTLPYGLALLQRPSSNFCPRITLLKTYL